MPRKISSTTQIRSTRPTVRVVPSIGRRTEEVTPKQKKISFVVIAAISVVLIALFIAFRLSRQQVITVGLNVELSGSIPKVGLSSQRGAHLAIKEVNDQGGLVRPEKQYPIRLIEEDDNANVDKTKQVTAQFVKDGALAMIGPNASKYAIAAASVAEPAHMLMISPWSTNPATTQDKKYIFRAAYIDPFQGKALAAFATETLHIKRVAVLYDATAVYSRDISAVFSNTFTGDGGIITTTKTFNAGDSDFSKQLNEIAATKPDIIFLPAYYNDAANIIVQSKKMNITIPFLGSDGWGSQEILSSCGDKCDGYYLSAHYAADSTVPVTKKFVEEYKKAYGELPDDVAALTYDAFGLLFKSIQNAPHLDREPIKDQMTQITDYHGVTGDMQFIPNSGNPQKSVVILQIKDGKFIYIQNISP